MPQHAPTSNELECPACGTVAVNRDFCACGEYLGWELTLAEGPAAPETEAYRPPAPVVPRVSTLLTLRDPASLEDAAAAVSVSVVPGAEVAVIATIRNQGEIVDTYDVRVDGLPNGWWSASPATVFLNPWGTSGDYQAEVRLRLHPPRTPEAQARAWPLTVVVSSRSRGADVAWAPATLTVEPFVSTAMRVGPERRRGRRHAGFDVAVANHGNRSMEIVIGAVDTEARCPVTVAPERRLVPVGQAAVAYVRVVVPKPLLVGRAVDHQIEVTHRVTGVEAEPVPQRVLFRQKPWLPWWVPPVLALLAAFIVTVLLLRRDAEVPKLKGSTVEEAVVVLDKQHLELGRTTYMTAPQGVPVNTILDQQPAAGDGLAKGERVNITLAAPPKTASVPPVNGLTLAAAADKLTGAGFAYNPQPSSAGNDWVVIRQQPTPGRKVPAGAQVTLAVKAPAPSATPTATPTPTATASASPAATPATAAGGAKPTTAAAAAAAKPAITPLPADLVFAETGRLYRWASKAAKPAPLTAARYQLETPAKTDEGYVAVQVTKDGRRLVRIAADGKIVTTLATGEYHRPAYSSAAGRLAVISGDGQGNPSDAGTLCLLDPQDPKATTCASGQRVGRPAWSANGHSVLALAAGPDGHYDELFTYTAQLASPQSAYRAPSLLSAAWVGNDRLAVLVADRAGAPAHLRLLARRANGSFKRLKDFPHLTGFELAAVGHHLALRSGNQMVLLDADRAQPRLRGLARGVNPAWAG